MIQQDQPTCFPSSVRVRVSSVSDGTMLNRTGEVHEAIVIDNRRTFCANVGTEYRRIVLQGISYGEHYSYINIREVTGADTTTYVDDVEADALITRAKGVGLMLAVADCIATVVYDPVNQVVALAHLGRHSTVAGLAEKTIEQLEGIGVCPEDVIVWMSPSAKKSHYVMQWFDQKDDSDWKAFCDEQSDGIHIDLQGYNRSRFIACGVRPSNIHISPVNTTTNTDYFSHSAGDTSRRFAVLVELR